MIDIPSPPEGFFMFQRHDLKGLWLGCFLGWFFLAPVYLSAGEEATEAEKPAPPEDITVTVKKVPWLFIGCPAGTFQMGSPAEEPLRGDDEPLHEVTISEPFWILQTEVTQGQWKSVMKKTPPPLLLLDLSGSPQLERRPGIYRRSQSGGLRPRGAGFRPSDRGRVGIRLPRRHSRSVGGSREYRPGRLVPGQQRKGAPRGRDQGPERLETVQHPRQRRGMVQRLVRPPVERPGHRPDRTGRRDDARPARGKLFVDGRALPVRRALEGLARQ
ncbi:MAG: SUMF1/EgtB/PvdO family nonheme iron enzyme [Thermoguttaceae bacterium]|nr:SUMF1/EgtB/PvdO family nonheme iron enzyme [Thermoguttaceae bacterium]